ncbi:MAG: hypothetical protein AAF366_13105 [Pseudomonadota bacterium]
MRALLVSLLLIPGLVQAGAWPRAAGEIYLSLSQEVDLDGWTGIYAEYGAPRDLTFGIDIGGHVARGGGALFIGDDEEEDATDGRAIAFLRVPLRVGTTRLPQWKFAAEVGLGADWDDDDTDGRLRLGLSVGRPLTTPLGHGWTNLDAKVEVSDTETARFGAGIVTGFRVTTRQTVELGLFAEREDTTSAAFLPTYQIGVPRLGDLRFGATIRFDGPTDLRIGFARTF